MLSCCYNLSPKLPPRADDTCFWLKPYLWSLIWELMGGTLVQDVRYVDGFRYELFSLLLLRVSRFILTGAEIPRWEKSCWIKGDK